MPRTKRNYSGKCWPSMSIIIRRPVGKGIELGQRGHRIPAVALSRPDPASGTQGPDRRNSEFSFCETSGAFEHESGRIRVPTRPLAGPFGTGIVPGLRRLWDKLRHFWDTGQGFSQAKAASMEGARDNFSALFCNIPLHFLRRWPAGREEVDPAWIHGKEREAGLARGRVSVRVGSALGGVSQRRRGPRFLPPQERRDRQGRNHPNCKATMSVRLGSVPGGAPRRRRESGFPAPPLLA